MVAERGPAGIRLRGQTRADLGDHRLPSRQAHAEVAGGRPRSDRRPGIRRTWRQRPGIDPAVNIGYKAARNRPLARGQKLSNKALAAVRAPVGHGVAHLKNWHVPGKCAPTRRGRPCWRGPCWSPDSQPRRERLRCSLWSKVRSPGPMCVAVACGQECVAGTTQLGRRTCVPTQSTQTHRAVASARRHRGYAPPPPLVSRKATVRLHLVYDWAQRRTDTRPCA